MGSNRATLRIGFLILFVIVVGVAIGFYVLKVPWKENVQILLGRYEEISGCFFIVSCGLVLFRWFTVKQKGVAPERHRRRLGFGPIADLAVDPLFDASLFYSALFMLYTIFEEHMFELSLDPLLILLGVAGYLLYYSIKDVYEMACKTFFVQSGEKPVQEN